MDGMMLYLRDLLASSLDATLTHAMNDARYPVRFAAAAFVQTFGRPLSDAIHVAGDLLPELQETDDAELLRRARLSCRC
jgi:hypothetical protein